MFVIIYSRSQEFLARAKQITISNVYDQTKRIAFLSSTRAFRKLPDLPDQLTFSLVQTVQYLLIVSQQGKGYYRSTETLLTIKGLLTAKL